MNKIKWQEELRGLLGKEQCVFDDAAIIPYLNTLTNTSKRIIGVVKPTSIEEIQQILRIANTYGFPVYPISQGNNWGYGEKLPVQHDNLIIDLSRLDSITNYNEELGYVSVQPGVTQQHLYEYLNERGLKHMVPVTGAGVFGSILGNAIDRGYGITPYCDHFQAITEMKVLLADGQLIQTGLSRFGARHSGPVFRWGIGPYQDGLYAQANFGIVVEVTLLLKKVPQTTKLVHFTAHSSSQLMQVLMALRGLYDEGVIGSGISLFNGLRAYSVSNRFPYKLLEQGDTEAREVLDQLVRKEGLSPWMGVFAVYGTPKIVNYHVKEIKRVLKSSTSKLMVFSQTTLKRLELLNKVFRSQRLTKAIKSIQILLNIVSGIPMRETLNQAFWRSKHKLKVNETTLASDIVAHDNGLLWFAPVIPFTYEHFTNIHNIVELILKKYGFECLFGCAGFSSHYLDVTIPILFNKEDSQEIERALACYDELFEQCLAAGYMPYRLGINKMNLLPHTPYDALNAKLKSVIDVNNILAPGRYVRNE